MSSQADGADRNFGLATAHSNSIFSIVKFCMLEITCVFYQSSSWELQHYRKWQTAAKAQGVVMVLTSVGLRRERCSGATLGSVTRASLSRLGVVDDGSQESSEPAEPCAAASHYSSNGTPTMLSPCNCIAHGCCLM